MAFDINLQLFGGGGSSSGLKGGGGEGKKQKKGGEEQLGYLFYFTYTKNGKQMGKYEWVPGNSPSEALKNAIERGKKANATPSNPLGEPGTKENIQKAFDRARERQKNKNKK